MGVDLTSVKQETGRTKQRKSGTVGRLVDRNRYQEVSVLIDKIAKQIEEAGRAFQLRGLRAEMLASNIANADTPNYKARDFDFRTALNRAIHASQVQMKKTDDAHISTRSFEIQRPQAMYRIPVQMAIDGNSVEVDMEVAKFSDNAIRYQAALTFLNEEIEHVRSAITS